MRVALADDAVLFREGLARVLADRGFEVTLQAGDADALPRALRRAVVTAGITVSRPGANPPTRAEVDAAA